MSQNRIKNRRFPKYENRGFCDTMVKTTSGQLGPKCGSVRLPNDKMNIDYLYFEWR